MSKSPVFALWSALSLCLLVPAKTRAQGQPAEIGLTLSASAARIINNVGGNTTIEAVVRNTAAVGSSSLDYQIQFQLPYGTSPPLMDTLAPQAEKKWTYVFDATLLQQPLQTSDFSATAIVTAPGASNSPLSQNKSIDVRNPATPLFLLPRIGTDPIMVEEPTISPEQFAATGGGETFAAEAPQVIGDPALDARLDFDRLDFVGDPEIVAHNINLFKNLDPFQPGGDAFEKSLKPFDVYLDKSHVGTFKKTFFLYFSDEDIPGARPPASIVRTLTYVFTVVPEPTTAVMVWSGSLLGCAARRRRRQAA
jgi:hypothetical protein